MDEVKRPRRPTLQRRGVGVAGKDLSLGDCFFIERGIYETLDCGCNSIGVNIRSSLVLGIMRC